MSNLLVLSDVCKRYGGAIALDGVSFTLRAGEVHALVGENGAGKSTLIKVLTGIVPKDGGTIDFDGRTYEPDSPAAAKAVGIQVVHQEFNLLPHLSIAENICIEKLPTKGPWIDAAKLHRIARNALTSVGLEHIDVRQPVSNLGVAHQQLVEIARALVGESRVLILDEPTATLTERETKRLFEIIASLKAKGVAIVFVSHHLNEIFSICDRATILRNGRSVVTTDIADTTTDDLVSHMVGRQLAAAMAEARQVSRSGETALSLRAWKPKGAEKTSGVNLDLHYGEILGVAGLVGSGRTELLRSIFGAAPVASGTLVRDGIEKRYRGPRDAIADRIAFATEDRKDEGLILNMSIASNVSLACLKSISKFGFLNFRYEAALAKRLGAEMKLKSGSSHNHASTLSGGNQQKVVLAKWLATQPKILLLDEPTRGIDVGAKAEIYSLLRGLADEGLALLVVSSELPELMTLCDRIIVMSKRTIAGELSHSAFSEEKILNFAYAEERVA